MVPDYLIPKFLPADSESRIEVVYPAGGLAFTAQPAIIRLLCRHHMVDGRVNRHGHLKYVRLLVSVQAARRVIHSVENHQDPRMVTRRIQGKGAKCWVARHDSAKTGNMGSLRSVFVPSGQL